MQRNINDLWRTLPKAHTVDACEQACFPEEPEEIAERLRRSEVSDVVVALDPVHAHSIETADLDAVVQGARSAVQDRELRVMLYGRQVADEPGITSRTHSDAAYATLAEMNGEALDPPSSA